MPDAPKKPDTSPGDAMIKAQPYMDAAWQFIGGVLLGALGGWFLDRHFHTSPWLLVAGLFLGFGAGFVSMIRALNRLDARKSPGKKGPS